MGLLILRLFIFAGAVFTVFPVLAGAGADAEIFDPPYLTDACSPGDKPGTVWGTVHESQIRIKSKRSDLLSVDPKKFIQCAENPSNVPESCAAENQAE